MAASITDALAYCCEYVGALKDEGVRPIEVDVHFSWSRTALEAVKKAFRAAGWAVFEVKGPKDRHYLEFKA